MYNISEERMKSYSARLTNLSIYKIKKAMDLLSILQSNEEDVYCHWKSLWDSVMCGDERRAINSLTTKVYEKLKKTYFKRKKYIKQHNVDKLLTSKVKTLQEAIEINISVIKILEEDGFELYRGRHSYMSGWTWGLYETSD